MAHSLSFLLSADAAMARFNRNPDVKFVVHLEMDNDSLMVELDADSAEHARSIARDWLINGRCYSAGVRNVGEFGTLGRDVDIFDITDFQDELSENTQRNLDRVMAAYGLIG